MMYQIAVCDDSDADNKYMTTLVNQWAEESSYAVKLDSFSSAENFLFRYEEKKDYDILLLDIEMGEKNGVELAKQIRGSNDQVQIIFVTGFPDFVMEGYEVAALHYLIKPVDKEKLSQVLDRAVGAMKKVERTLLFSTEDGLVRIPARDILAAEAFAHTIVITTKKDSFPVSMSISEAEKHLGEGFVRCHRSYIVGLSHVKKIMRTAVVLDSGAEIPLSRSNYRAVNQAFIDYYKV